SELFYVPKQKHLGDFNTDFGDELYLIEERQESNLQHYDNADDMESSMDIIAKVRKDEKYKIDEVAYIRARLFDMLIGDWDRHRDQRRSAQGDQANGANLYKAIPSERGQAFSNFDGAWLHEMKLISLAAKAHQVYDGTLTGVTRMNS